LAFCNETDTTLGLRSFIALAREKPSSEMLLDHCWRVFGREVTGQHERHSADQIPYGPKEIAQQFSDWVTALHLASARSGAEEFVEVALAMINRDTQGIWDFQDITNRAVVDRLQRDVKVVRHLKDRLHSNPTES
jgi:hypothetical protein